MQTIFEKWIEKGKWDVVMNSLREGIPIDVIAKISGFTAAQINEFREKMKDQQVNAAA
jgi:ribosomal protein L10